MSNIDSFTNSVHEIARESEFKKCLAPMRRGCAARFLGPRDWNVIMIQCTDWDWSTIMLVTHANTKGLCLISFFGDHHGFMPPQLKTKQIHQKVFGPIAAWLCGAIFGATWLECDDDALAANFSIKQLLNVWWVRCIGYKSLPWKLKSREMTGCYSTAAATHWTRIENVIYLVKFMFSKKTTKFDDM